jgi:alginate O-acetyltransferase complex protein AlgJ
MVPLKMRIYAEYLPDNVRLNPYLESNYERMSDLLRRSGVAVADINTAFLNSPKRNSASPLFYKLDTHWSLTGAMVAAEAVKKEIESTPSLKKAFGSTSVEGYNLVVGKRQIPSQGRDLIEQLPPNSMTFSFESVMPVSVVRVRPQQQGLFGGDSLIGIALLGSSYSRDWTGFPDALRYVLQRDIFSMGVGADQGSWVGMESYLRDDAFQLQAPKLLIWELPERDMRAPPDYAFRESRYISNNTEWLLRVSAWVQKDCRPSAAMAKFSQMSLGGRSGALLGQGLTTGPTNEGEFFEIEFDRQLHKLDYVSFLATAHGASSWVFEGSGGGANSRKFTVNINGDGRPHLIKTPIPSNTNGFTKVRIFPGKTGGIELRQVQVCSQPADLLG